MIQFLLRLVLKQQLHQPRVLVVYSPVERSHLLDSAHEVNVAGGNIKQSLTTFESIILNLLSIVVAIPTVALYTAVQQRRISHVIRFVDLKIYSKIVPLANNPVDAVEVPMSSGFLEGCVAFSVFGKQDALNLVPGLCP